VTRDAAERSVLSDARPPGGVGRRGNRRRLGDPEDSGPAVWVSSKDPWRVDFDSPRTGKHHLSRIGTFECGTLVAQLVATMVAQSVPGGRIGYFAAFSAWGIGIRAFARYVDSALPDPSSFSLESIDPAFWDRWESHLVEKAGGAPRTKIARADHARMMIAEAFDVIGVFDPVMTQRLTFNGRIELRNVKVRGVTDPYPDEVAKALYVAAMGDIRRIRDEFDSGDRSGLVHRDTISFRVALGLQAGLPPESVWALDTQCLTAQGDGKATLRYRKDRATNRTNQSVRVEDGGIMTPGGLIRLLIRVTATDRQELSTETGSPVDDLFVFRHDRPREDLTSASASELADLGRRGGKWLRDMGLAELIDPSTQRPLALSGRKLRKTHSLLGYRATGDLEDMPRDHGRDVTVDYYANPPAMLKLHQQAAVRGIEDAVRPALRVLDPVATPAGADKLAADLAAGKLDAGPASCVSVTDGPFSTAGDPCPVAGYGCFTCPNAVLVLSERALVRMLRYRVHLVEQKELMTSSAFQAAHGHAWNVIHNHYLPRFTADQIEAAEAAASTPLYIPPEQRQ